MSETLISFLPHFCPPDRSIFLSHRAVLSESLACLQVFAVSSCAAPVSCCLAVPPIQCPSVFHTFPGPTFLPFQMHRFSLLISSLALASFSWTHPLILPLYRKPHNSIKALCCTKFSLLEHPSLGFTILGVCSWESCLCPFPLASFVICHQWCPLTDI